MIEIIKKGNNPCWTVKKKPTFYKLTCNYCDTIFKTTEDECGNMRITTDLLTVRCPICSGFIVFNPESTEVKDDNDN